MNNQLTVNELIAVSAQSGYLVSRLESGWYVATKRVYVLCKCDGHAVVSPAQCGCGRRVLACVECQKRKRVVCCPKCMRRLTRQFQLELVKMGEDGV